MISYEFKQYFINVLQKNVKPCNTNTGKTELIIRCPYCGDSTKDERHAHMYIGLDKDSYFPFYCQRCASTGVVDMGFLKDINVIDATLFNNIEKINKEAKFDKTKVKKSTDNDYKFTVEDNDKNLELPLFSNKKVEQKKYEYINNRYSFDLHPDIYVSKYKVIFSFKNFIELNDINFLNANDYMISKLSKNYIGFLSADQSYIIFRNIDPECSKKERYYMYNIFDKQNGKRFYTIDCMADLLSPKITLVLSEGPFDIIGIKEYMYKDTDKNIIFASVNGKGYNLVINHFARMGFLNMDIEIYSDKDVPITKYKQLREYCPSMKNNKVRIWYNKLEKDYGVIQDKIELYSKVL
jgi:hypothetical protein